MDNLKTLQHFFVTWMDELWWSMRDRVGALSMINCFENSWKAAGKTVGEVIKAEGMKPEQALEAAHTLLGRTVKHTNKPILVLNCPFWNQMLKGGLEYALHCEEFICQPYITGIKESLGAKDAVVETSLRLAHITRAKLEYKISKLKSADPSDSAIQSQIAELENQLAQLPKQPNCIFHIK